MTAADILRNLADDLDALADTLDSDTDAIDKAYALVYDRSNDWRDAQSAALRELNQRGLSWAQLGDVFGVTRQAVQQRATA